MLHLEHPLFTLMTILCLHPDWSIPHTTGRSDRRQKCRERSYYHLHRQLNHTLLFHTLISFSSTTNYTNFSNYPVADYADESKQNYDEILIERNRSGGYWLHFAVRPKDNRRKTMFLQK